MSDDKVLDSVSEDDIKHISRLDPNEVYTYTNDEGVKVSKTGQEIMDEENAIFEEMDELGF